MSSTGLDCAVSVLTAGLADAAGKSSDPRRPHAEREKMARSDAINIIAARFIGFT